MSIINEALKKAWNEKEAVPSSGYQETVRKKLDLEYHKKGSRLNWGPIFIILVLLLITGPIIAPLFSTPFQKTTPGIQTVTAKGNPSLNRKSQFGMEEAPLFGGTAGPMMLQGTPRFNLSGVVYSAADSSFCIINNKVLKVGENVQGATLVKITPNGALLDFKGNQIELSISQ